MKLRTTYENSLNMLYGQSLRHHEKKHYRLEPSRRNRLSANSVAIQKQSSTISTELQIKCILNEDLCYITSVHGAISQEEEG